MAEWTRRFTDEQRTALLHAVYADGITKSAAARMAAAGELPVPGTDDQTLKPFKISRQTVSQLCTQQGDAYNVQLLRDSARATRLLDETTAEFLDVVRRKRDAMRAKTRAGDDISWDEARAAFNAISAGRKALEPGSPRPRLPKPGADQTPNGQDGRRDDVLKRLGVKKPRAKTNGTRTQPGSSARSPSSDAPVPANGSASAA